MPVASKADSSASRSRMASLPLYPGLPCREPRLGPTAEQEQPVKTARRTEGGLDRLFRPAAEIVDQANLAARPSGETGVAAMQDQPVMGMEHEFGRHHAQQFNFHLERRLARRKSRAIGDAKDVRIHSQGAFAERHVEHDI